MVKTKKSSGRALVILGRASPTQFASDDTATAPNAQFWLNNLNSQLGSRKKAKRKGRGRGQKSRSGLGVRRWFKGGQMPLYRLIPKLRGIAGGKCLEVHGEIHEAHEIVLQSSSVLVGRNAFSAHSSVPLSFLLYLIGKDIPGDPLAVERATILYNICWFTLKSYFCNGTKHSSTASTHLCIHTIYLDIKHKSDCDFLRSREVGEFLSGSLAGVVTKAVLTPFETIRYGYNHRYWSEDEKGMRNNFTRTQIRAHKKRRLSFLPQACFALVTT